MRPLLPLIWVRGFRWDLPPPVIYSALLFPDAKGRNVSFFTFSHNVFTICPNMIVILWLPPPCTGKGVLPSHLNTLVYSWFPGLFVSSIFTFEKFFRMLCYLLLPLLKFVPFSYPTAFLSSIRLLVLCFLLVPCYFPRKVLLRYFKAFMYICLVVVVYVC